MRTAATVKIKGFITISAVSYLTAKNKTPRTDGEIFFLPGAMKMYEIIDSEKYEALKTIPVSNNIGTRRTESVLEDMEEHLQIRIN
jgi:hypothetical protein